MEPTTTGSPCQGTLISLVGDRTAPVAWRCDCGTVFLDPATAAQHRAGVAGAGVADDPLASILGPRRRRAAARPGRTAHGSEQTGDAGRASRARTRVRRTTEA